MWGDKESSEGFLLPREGKLLGETTVTSCGLCAKQHCCVLFSLHSTRLTTSAITTTIATAIPVHCATFGAAVVTGLGTRLEVVVVVSFVVVVVVVVAEFTDDDGDPCFESASGVAAMAKRAGDARAASSRSFKIL